MTRFRVIRFVLTFACCLTFGFCVLFTAPVQFVDAQFSRALVGICQSVVATGGGYAIREGAVLRSRGGFAVEMRDGCNAINVTILLWSAILAFPAPWKMKVLGLLAGSAIVQLLNIVRFISLYYLGQYSLTWFDFAHAYLWESLLVLDTMVVFWLWVNRVSRIAVIGHAGA